MMKKINILFGLIILCLFPINTISAIDKEEYVKKVSKEFNASDINTMEINNIYGDINLITENIPTDKILIDVKIQVDAKDQEAANEIFDRIKINLNQSGGLASGVTEILEKKSGWFSSWMSSWNSYSDDFKIIYTIHLPKGITINLTNKYGNIYTDNFDGKTNLTIKYGELHAKSFTNNVDLELKYGKGWIDETGDLDLEVAYSELKIKKAKNVDAETRYSKLRIGTIQNIDIDSRYDNYTIDSVQEVEIDSRYGGFDIDYAKIVESDASYTGLDIDFLENSGDFEHNYGDVSIDELGNDFSVVKAEMKYCDFEVEVNTNFLNLLEVESRYGDIDYPSGYFQKNKDEETNSIDLEVIYNQSAKGKIIASASYGDVEVTGSN